MIQTEAFHQQSRAIRAALDDLRIRASRLGEIRLTGAAPSVLAELRTGMPDQEAWKSAKIMDRSRARLARVLNDALAEAEVMCSAADDAIDEAGLV